MIPYWSENDTPGNYVDCKPAKLTIIPKATRNVIPLEVKHFEGDAECDTSKGNYFANA